MSEARSAEAAVGASTACCHSSVQQQSTRSAYSTSENVVRIVAKAALYILKAPKKLALIRERCLRKKKRKALFLPFKGRQKDANLKILARNACVRECAF